MGWTTTLTRPMHSHTIAGDPIKNRTYGLVTLLNTGHFVTQVEAARRAFPHTPHSGLGIPLARLLNSVTPVGPSRIA
jgi:hypothetical protein